MWLDFAQILYTYNESGLLIMEEQWEFDWEMFMVVKTWQYDYVWDSDGNLIEQVDKNWVLRKFAKRVPIQVKLRQPL